MFSAGSGQTVAVTRVNFSIAVSSVLVRWQRSQIGQMTADRGGGDHRRRHDVGARADTLAAAKVAIGGRGAAFAGGDQVAVYSNAHRTAGIGPLQPGVAKYPVETFLFCLSLDAGRTRRHQAGYL